MDSCKPNSALKYHGSLHLRGLLCRPRGFVVYVSAEFLHFLVHKVAEVLIVQANGKFQNGDFAQHFDGAVVGPFPRQRRELSEDFLSVRIPCPPEVVCHAHESPILFNVTLSRTAFATMDALPKIVVYSIAKSSDFKGHEKSVEMPTSPLHCRGRFWKNSYHAISSYIAEESTNACQALRTIARRFGGSSTLPQKS